MTNKRSIFGRAIGLLNRYRANLIRRRDVARIAGLPDYLLKDIGWPASKLDLCNDCAQ